MDESNPSLMMSNHLQKDLWSISTEFFIYFMMYLHRNSTENTLQINILNTFSKSLNMFQISYSIYSYLVLGNKIVHVIIRMIRMASGLCINLWV